MNNYRTGIAEELVAREADVRASLFGRTVWRNWAMDKFKTRRGDWVKLGKAGEDYQGLAGTAPGPPPSPIANGGKGEVKKSAIQLARERRAVQRKQLLARKLKTAPVGDQGKAVKDNSSRPASQKRWGEEDGGPGVYGAAGGPSRRGARGGGKFSRYF